MFRFLSSAHWKAGHGLHWSDGRAFFSSSQLFQGRLGVHIVSPPSLKAKVKTRLPALRLDASFRSRRQCFSNCQHEFFYISTFSISHSSLIPGLTKGLPPTNRARGLAHAVCSHKYAPQLVPSIRQKSSSASKTAVQKSTSASTREQRRLPSYLVAAVVAVGVAMYVVFRHSKYQNNPLETTFQVEAKSPKRRDRGTDLGQATSVSLQEAIVKATDLCQKVKDETGSPGLVVAVSVDGRQVWSEGLGYADIENRVPCRPDSVMRIASISKSITMAAVAKAMESGDLDLDKPVQHYVPKFPEKTVKGEKVTVTTRQLVSHLSGIRHYSKDYMKDKSADKPSSGPAAPTCTSDGKKSAAEGLNVNVEFSQMEYYIKDEFESTEAALALFKDDPLLYKPDTKFLYTTHGWTLVAAVLEGATKKKFPVLIRNLFHDLGLDHTYLDENGPLIYNRARFYVHNKKGRLVNTPYVDCSYKYAGGGLLSTVTDLVHFGNVMLYSYQYGGHDGSSTVQETGSTPLDQGVTDTAKLSDHGDSSAASPSCQRPLPGYLKQSTVQQIWTPVDLAQPVGKEEIYAMGWAVVPEKQTTGFGRKLRYYINHTGAAVGASSVLLILPPGNDEMAKGGNSVATPPRGVCVAIIVNMISVSLTKTALQIAHLFEGVEEEED